MQNVFTIHQDDFAGGAGDSGTFGVRQRGGAFRELYRLLAQRSRMVRDSPLSAGWSDMDDRHDHAGGRRHGGFAFSMDAWTSVTFTAAEVKNPGRNLPLSLALGTGIVILLYTLANVAYLRVLPLAGDPAGAKASRWRGELNSRRTGASPLP